MKEATININKCSSCPFCYDNSFTGTFCYHKDIDVRNIFGDENIPHWCPLPDSKQDSKADILDIAKKRREIIFDEEK